MIERLYLDPGENIRFRVDSVEWQDVRPAPPPQYNAAGELVSTEPEKDPIDKAGFKIYVRAPYGQYDDKADGGQASIAESGLGVISWWNQGGDEEEEEMEA